MLNKPQMSQNRAGRVQFCFQGVLGRPKPPWNRKNKNPTNDEKNEFKNVFLNVPYEKRWVGRTPNQSVGQPQQQQRQTKTNFSNRGEDDKVLRSVLWSRSLAKMGTTRGYQTEDERAVKTCDQQRMYLVRGVKGFGRFRKMAIYLVGSTTMLCRLIHFLHSKTKSKPISKNCEYPLGRTRVGPNGAALGTGMEPCTQAGG